MYYLQRHFPAMLLAASSPAQRKGKENKKRRRNERDHIMDESIALPDPQTLLLDQASPPLDFYS